MAERTPDNSLLLWIPKVLLKTCNQLNPLLPALCCTAEQAPIPCTVSPAEAHTTVWKAWNAVKMMSGFSATHFHLISTSELQKPSCILHLVRKEEPAEFLSIISRLVPSWTPPCASLEQNYRVMHLWAHTPTDGELWQVNLWASCSKQDAMENKPPAHSHPSASCPQAESHIRRYFIFPFLFKQFITTNRHSRDAE